jgi:hypothetical protein
MARTTPKCVLVNVITAELSASQLFWVKEKNYCLTLLQRKFRETIQWSYSKVLWQCAQLKEKRSALTSPGYDTKRKSCLEATNL